MSKKIIVTMEIEETRDPTRGDWWTEIDGKMEIVRVVQTVSESPSIGGIFFRGDRLGNNYFREDEREFWGPIPQFVPPESAGETPATKPPVTGVSDADEGFPYRREKRWGQGLPVIEG